ncbi:MAG TPA: thioesterase family protein [Mycobacteriales bacterium]|nr:thioesterase family protein [Mycobacteriales bacterium]
MPFTMDVTIRFSDADALGHVNNATFLTYLEDARIHFLDELVPDVLKAGLIMARSECDYVRPIRLSRRPVSVAIWVESIGTSSFRLGYTIEQDGEIAARASTVVVAYDYEASRSRPLRDVERVALEGALAEKPVRPGEDEG